jgi:AcrR family transcriptional regulator
VARRRFEQLPKERREEILRVAAAEFARSGFHGTSYNQLLERLQLGKSSAYYYFEDKRDLFLTALQHCYQTYFTAMGSLPRPAAASEFWDYVRQATVIGYGMMLEDPTAASLMQCMQREKALLGELVSNELLASMAGFYDEVVAEGQRLDAIRDDLPQKLLVDLVLDIAMTFDRWFITERDRGSTAATPEDAARLFTDVARRLCSPR